MSTLSNYIASLNSIADDMPNIARGIVLKNSGDLLGTLKLRLFNRGLDGNLRSLGTYAPRTIKYKRSQGQRASFVTLRDSGNWYGGMFVEFNNDDLIIDSGDWKTELLESVYGDAILDLTEAEQNIFIDSKLDPEIDKLINDLGDLDLEI